MIVYLEKLVKIDPHPLATKIFLKSIELLGGLKKLTEYKTLTWLPSMARAAYVVVLREEFQKTIDEIAKEVGLTKQTVKNILSSNPELALEKLKNIDEVFHKEKENLKTHTAGAIAKLAYKLIKEGQEPKIFFDFSSQILESISSEVPWAYQLLKLIKEKDIDFPLENKEELREKLKGFKIKGKPIEEIILKIPFPINNPAILLKEIKKAL